MNIGFETIVKQVISMLPDGAAKMIFGYLDTIGTSLSELFGWAKNPPTPERKKELVKKVLMSVQPYVTSSLQFLEETKGANAGIFIQLVDTPNGQRPYVHIVTPNEDGTLSTHEQFFFHETGGFIISTLADIADKKKQLELAAGAALENIGRTKELLEQPAASSPAGSPAGSSVENPAGVVSPGRSLEPPEKPESPATATEKAETDEPAAAGAKSN